VKRYTSLTQNEIPPSPIAADDNRERDLDEGKLSAVLAGARQYADLLGSADSASIAIILTLWQANRVQMLENHRAFYSLGLPTSLSGSRLTILRTLYFAPDKRMTMGAISKATGISPTMVTNLVEGLARGGLVHRAGSAEDRRVSIAHLTEAGEEAFHRILPVMSARMTEACKDFTDEEKHQLLALLQKLL
jgi:DNA-binding MarR family transcriptional regulator